MFIYKRPVQQTFHRVAHKVNARQTLHCGLFPSSLFRYKRNKCIQLDVGYIYIFNLKLNSSVEKGFLVSTQIGITFTFGMSCPGFVGDNGRQKQSVVGKEAAVLIF